MESKEIIFSELEDVDMVLFIMEGSCRVGFVINSKQKMVVKIGK